MATKILFAATMLLPAAVLVAGDQQDATQHLLRGRVTVKRDAQRIRGDYELLLELENACGHAAEFNFDPKDLTVELRGASGKAIPEETTLSRSGPIPQPHQGVIPCGASVVLPTHRGGVGIPASKRLFAAGWQVWYLSPGTYTVKGRATVSLKHGEKYIEPLLPSRSSPHWAKLGVLPVGEEARVVIELAETKFLVE
jgi:hypothetical protein